MEYLSWISATLLFTIVGFVVSQWAQCDCLFFGYNLKLLVHMLKGARIQLPSYMSKTNEALMSSKVFVPALKTQ